MAIHIKKKNVGKFTAYKKRTGKTTAEALHSSDPHVRQMANFARNAKTWHHPFGGIVGGPDQYTKEQLRRAAITTVNKNINVPLTDFNVNQKIIQNGWFNGPIDSLRRLTPEQRQSYIPADSNITYEKVKKGTANQGGYKYYDKTSFSEGTDVTLDGKTIIKDPSKEWIKKNYPNHRFGFGGQLENVGSALSMIPGAGMIFGSALKSIGGQMNQPQINNQPMIDAANAGQAGIMNPYAQIFAMGGITPNGTPIEVEQGEVMRNPQDGSLAKISDGAPTHAQGGVDTSAEPGTQIYGKMKVKNGRFKGLTYKEAADRIKKQLAQLDKD